jgi:ABC-type branched-subunit amino acid transport system substrate-binding protein
MAGFVQRYSALHQNLSRRLLSNASLLYDPQIVARVRGLVVGGSLPFQPTSAIQGYVAAFAKAFPAIPAASALSPLAVPYRDGVEAVLEALQRTDGSTGPKLMAALAHLELDSPSGRIRLDRNRQAIGPNYLSRVTTGADGKPSITTLRVVPDVEQTFGGYFKPDDPPPSRTSPACKHGNPPPWAR